MAYAARGFHTFVLRYSTGHDAAGFSPLKEVSWVIGYIRENAEKWHIDPEKIVTCGFSAGGHLALSAGILGRISPMLRFWDILPPVRPIYPVPTLC